MIFVLFIGGMVATALWSIPWGFQVSCGFLALCHWLLEEYNRSPMPSVSLRRFWWMVGVFSVFLAGALGMGILVCVESASFDFTAFAPFGVFLAAGMHKGFIYSNDHGTWRISYFDAIFIELPYVFKKRRQRHRKK